MHRRFDRMGRLIGDPAMEKLARSHVMVIGLGGVGSWVAESIARSGVGRMTIVDFDDICVTNINRQLHAQQNLVGQKKALVMQERLKRINPQLEIQARPEFYNAESSEAILADRPDYIVDAIDNLTAKCHLIATAKARGIPLVTSAGASARLDPGQIQMLDLAETTVDPMAHQVRKILRQQYGFPREGTFDIPCVFSSEIPRVPFELAYEKGEGFKCVCPHGQNDLHSCERRRVIYGTASFVTGAFGFRMAGFVVNELTKDLSVAPVLKEPATLARASLASAPNEPTLESPHLKESAGLRPMTNCCHETSGV